MASEKNMCATSVGGRVRPLVECIAKGRARATQSLPPRVGGLTALRARGRNACAHCEQQSHRLSTLWDLRVKSMKRLLGSSRFFHLTQDFP